MTLYLLRLLKPGMLATGLPLTMVSEANFWRLQLSTWVS